ncbi:MAG: PhzF family phenazine biosynthesis protein [Nitrospinae bacterium]|nr:PhzF family phenazine biosynthesis protein [Nitrospinota bacterium]
METPFYQVDVFSDELFGGNPLAVFLRGEDFNKAQLQQVAREMNLSETTFIFPASNSEADFDVRIFTPEKEIPFAGHPSLGTAFVLRHAGLVPSSQSHLRLNFKAGLIPVHLEESGKIFMTQPPGEILQTFSDIERVAQVLGLNKNNIETNLPVQTASTGFSALLVPINSLRAMQRIVLNLSLLKELLDEAGVDMIYPFTRETIDSKNSIHARGFAPFIGIPEDPATGSVAGALGYYLNDKNPDENEIIIEQGFEMKRPGNIFVEMAGSEEKTPSIRVGGKTRLVFKASLYVE